MLLNCRDLVWEVFQMKFVFDLVGWVLIKHPWSLSFKEFYVDYQPWLTFIYIAIFVGPIIGWAFTLI